MTSQAITGFDDLVLTMFEHFKGLDADGIKAQCEKSGTPLNKVRRALRVMKRAEDNAYKFGLIGVGVISYKNARIAKFCQRVNLTK